MRVKSKSIIALFFVLGAIGVLARASLGGLQPFDKVALELRVVDVNHVANDSMPVIRVLYSIIPMHIQDRKRPAEVISIGQIEMCYRADKGVPSFKPVVSEEYASFSNQYLMRPHAVVYMSIPVTLGKLPTALAKKHGSHVREVLLGGHALGFIKLSRTDIRYIVHSDDGLEKLPIMITDPAAAYVTACPEPNRMRIKR
jgi:hypothetical protein